jgi:hypothetical protein
LIIDNGKPLPCPLRRGINELRPPPCAVRRGIGKPPPNPLQRGIKELRPPLNPLQRGIKEGNFAFFIVLFITSFVDTILPIFLIINQFIHFKAAV